MVVADIAGARLLERIGATELALAELQAGIPGTTQPLTEWLESTRLQLDLLHRNRQWNAIYDLAGRLPPGVPDAVVREMQVHAVRALVGAGRTDDARRLLRRLLWQSHDATAAERRIWRQWVVKTYLVDDNSSDADTAMRRYLVEFPAEDPSLQLLHARSLLQSGLPEAALRELVGLHGTEARLLTLLAHSEAPTPLEPLVQSQARQLALDESIATADRYRARVVQARAADRLADQATRVEALELALNTIDLPADPLFRATAEDLHAAYSDLAMQIGNARGLLVGDTAEWLKLAALDDSGTTRQRAIHSLIARDPDTALRDSSITALVRLLVEDDLGYTAYRLVNDGGLQNSTPDTARYLLGRWMAGQDRMDLAAELFAGLVTPPAGIDAAAWDLTRARIALYDGDISTGIALLGSVMQGSGSNDSEQVTRILQVVFDLQTLERHDETLGFLRRLYAMSTDAGQRREILFWTADSHAALGEYREAAVHYLRSAYYPGADANDLWGQSAVYKAAEAAARAGYNNDAEALYQQLIALAQDSGRRALLKIKVQQLWLNRNSDKPASIPR